eukprot:TRINITY_DN9068_c0_g5_i1.p1 TRINITY_DN9068_c0_g5~~TRINITY_DN9068_c0_g5_i1.p1  ORF type:complete len:175 (-),score=39.72 TRINITY_DN9068_c0_g5_i1:75-599(-)
MGFMPFHSAAWMLLFGMDCAAAGLAATSKIDLRIQAAGSQSFALYEYIVHELADMESFWHVTETGKEANVMVQANTTIKLVSGDMKFRALILVDKSKDDAAAKRNHPFKLCFFNQMAGDTNSFELTSGTGTGKPQSIDASWHCRSADYGLEFFLRDKDTELIAKVYVKNPKDEL